MGAVELDWVLILNLISYHQRSLYPLSLQINACVLDIPVDFSSVWYGPSDLESMPAN